MRWSSAASRSIRAGSADQTASAATTMSSEVAYSSFIRSTSAASENRSLSLPVPVSVGAFAVAVAAPATVTLAPRSSSVSSDQVLAAGPASAASGSRGRSATRPCTRRSTPTAG